MVVASTASTTMNCIEQPLQQLQQQQQQQQSPPQPPRLDLTGKPFPPIVDPEVFKELPLDVQQELIQQWQGQVPNQGTSNSKPSTVTSSLATESHSAAMIKAKPATKNAKANTLRRYFITHN